VRVEDFPTMLPGIMSSLVSFTMIPKNSSSAGADSTAR
jgi:hypothetical protein